MVDPDAYYGPVDPGPGPSVSGGSFEVEPENIQTLINGLKDAVTKLEEINMTAGQKLGNLRGPGADDYSQDAARIISERALEEDGAHGAANKAFREALEATISNLETTLAEYQRIEEENSRIGNIDV